jgi:hypothetical protein
LRGYYWDQRTNSLKYKKKGVDAFCFGIGLLALKGQRACRELLGRVDSYLIQSTVAAMVTTAR